MTLIPKQDEDIKTRKNYWLNTDAKILYKTSAKQPLPVHLPGTQYGSRGDKGKISKMLRLWRRMPKSSPTLIKASERGGDLVSPIGGERVEKDLGYLQILHTHFPQILGSCPAVFLCPREGLGSRKNGEE